MQSEAIRGNQRQSVALIFNHLLSESIGGNQIASETMREAIGGNRRHNGQRADPRCAITNDESQSGIAIIRQSVQLQRSEFRIGIPTIRGNPVGPRQRLESSAARAQILYYINYITRPTHHHPPPEPPATTTRRYGARRAAAARCAAAAHRAAAARCATRRVA